MKRITARRLDYLFKAMIELGYPPHDAHQRAVLAYTTWLGLAETERAMAGALFSSREARRRYIALLQDLVLDGSLRTAAQ